jgi:hypothetical protein
MDGWCQLCDDTLYLVNRPVAHLLVAPGRLFYDSNGRRIELQARHLPAQSKRAKNLDTQLLFGEPLIALGERRTVDGSVYLKVAAPWQVKYSKEKRIVFFEGWVEKDNVVAAGLFDFTQNAVVACAKRSIAGDPYLPLSIGTLVCRVHNKDFFPVERMSAISMPGVWYQERFDGSRSMRFEAGRLAPFFNVKDKGSVVVESALQFLGMPYFWGGASSFDPENMECATGVDCSGLVKLCYATAGLLVPRDSGDQWRFSIQVDDFERLDVGDLIFFAHEKNDIVPSVYHVAIFCGKDQKDNAWLIEAFGCPGFSENSDDEFERHYVHHEARIRLRTGAEMLGEQFTALKNGDIIRGGTRKNERVYFGSLLKAPALSWNDMVERCLVAVKSRS